MTIHNRIHEQTLVKEETDGEKQKKKTEKMKMFQFPVNDSIFCQILLMVRVYQSYSAEFMCLWMYIINKILTDDGT